MDTQDFDSEKYVWVFMWYDEDGGLSIRENVDTTGKVIIYVTDEKGYYSRYARPSLNSFLLKAFEERLDEIYGYINNLATDMDNDVVAFLCTVDRIPLAYFYEGEYHLWAYFYQGEYHLWEK